jgi:RimJ/RimL family protein N-acetyltransferase
MLDQLNPIELNGNVVALVPLEPSHREGLLEAASDGKLWELWYTSVPSAESIDRYIEVALAEKSQGNSYAFTIFQREMNQIVGSTRYLNIDHQHRRLEIGHTWYGKSVQRTAVNTECKYLLLRYAFESLNCIAVEFRTHWHNHRSRNAILRLGAKQDGILRNHRIGAQGVLRDTVVYSIIESEWPTVKRSMDFKMKQYNIP